VVAKPDKVCVADLRAEAIRGLVASAGIVDRDPGGAREPGAQHLAVLRQEAVLAGYQQTHELPFGDDDAERPQLRQ
jgi:hypothetical protein